METFGPLKPFALNPGFAMQRARALDALACAQIDAPIADIIAGLNRLPGCFTLQCCHGHFLYPGQGDEHCLKPLPDSLTGVDQVDYRIAYVALCLEGSPAGRALLAGLAKIARQDPAHIQLGSPDWFWQRQVNSFALQVEPLRFQHQDRALIPYDEALALQEARDAAFAALRGLLSNTNT